MILFRVVNIIRFSLLLGLNHSVFGFSSCTWSRCQAAAATATALYSSPIQPPPNEFVRIFKTEKLQSSNRRRDMSGRGREYNMNIEATEEECEALAQRFDLQDLTKLNAELKLQALPGSGSTGASNVAVVVQVVGTIYSHLTRTCVRTCEDFPVDIELPFKSIVRPVSDSFWSDVGTALQDDTYDEQPKKKKKKNTRNSRRNNNVNDIDMRDLESQLTLQLLMDDDDFIGDDDNSNVVEDEAIYSLQNDSMDVGELVAQTFWLNLDPYPKKPGTDPMELSITG